MRPPVATVGARSTGAIRLVRSGRSARWLRRSSSYPCLMRGLRWLSVIVPVVTVAIIEIISDGLLDSLFPFPVDTIVVIGLVAILAWAFSAVAFRRIDALSAELRARNAEPRTARGVGARPAPGERRDRRPRDLDEILDAIVRQARDRLGADVADPADPSARWRSHTSPPRRGPDDAIDRSGGFPGQDAARFVRPDLAVARLEAPLQRASETIGLLLVGSRRERGFEVDELETLSSLANQAAIAIENARLQARLRELAVVAERERIAREMHDGLAQVLGYVNTKSQAIEELLVAGRTDAAREQLAELAAAARSIYVDVREAILGLRSPVVPGLGLVDGGRGLCGTLRRGVEDRGPRRRPARRPPARGRARRGGAGLPDRPGGADERSQARRRARVPRSASTFATAGSRWSSATTDTAVEAPPSTDDRPRYGLRAMRERAASIGAHGRLDDPARRRLVRRACRSPADPRIAGRIGDRLMRIVLADDHALFRDGVSSLLQAWGHEVVGSAADGRAAVDLVLRLQPDLVLMDVRMPGMSGRGGDPRDRARPARDADRHAHGQRGRGRPVRGDPGRRPWLPAQGPRGGPAARR